MFWPCREDIDSATVIGENDVRVRKLSHVAKARQATVTVITRRMDHLADRWEIQSC